MHALFPFSLTKHFICIIFLLLSDIRLYLVSMWSLSGNAESRIASFGKSGPYLNNVAVVVTVEDFSGGLPLEAFPSLQPRANQQPMFSVL